MTTPPSLKLSTDLSLPADAAVQKFAWLGISGSGKTYGCGKLVEVLIEHHNQVVVLDTIGNWWGLRLAANGKSPGLQIPILGGDHGDIDLDPRHGKLAAQTVVGTSASMVLDVSGFTGGELRAFVIDFAHELLVEGRKAPAPRHIVWEECQDILPQRVFGEDAKVLGAVQRLIKKGRNYGFGHSLISQRVAAVNKEVLNQCTTVFAFRTIGKLDRKSVEDWQEAHGVDEEPVRLSSLETGTCLVYSPEWRKTTSVHTIGKKWTFDASATPDFTAQPRSFTLSKVDLAKFTKSMGEAIQKAKENDPEHLRRRIAELEKVVGSHSPTSSAIDRSVEIEQRLADAERELDDLRARYDDAIARAGALGTWTEQISSAVSELDAQIAKLQNLDAMPMHAAYVGASPRASSVRPMASVPRRAHGETEMTPMQRKFLVALAQHGTLTRKQLLLHTGYTAGGTPNSALASLIGLGLVVVPQPGSVAITEAGKTTLGNYERLPVGRRLFERVRSEHEPMTQKFLDALASAYPASMTRKDLLAATGYTAGGTPNSAIARMVTKCYVTKEPGSALRLSDTLVDRPVRR